MKAFAPICSIFALLLTSCILLREGGVFQEQAQLEAAKKMFEENQQGYMSPCWTYQGTDKNGLDVFAVPTQLAKMAGRQKFTLFRVAQPISPVKAQNRFHVDERTIRKNVMSFDPHREYFYTSRYKKSYREFLGHLPEELNR